MELCLLNLLILIEFFVCNSYPYVLFEKLSHVIDQEFVKFIREICEKFTSFLFEILKSPSFHSRDFEYNRNNRNRNWYNRYSIENQNNSMIQTNKTWKKTIYP